MHKNGASCATLLRHHGCTPDAAAFFNFYDIHMLCYRNHFIVNLLAESLPVICVKIALLSAIYVIIQAY